MTERVRWRDGEDPPRVLETYDDGARMYGLHISERSILSKDAELVIRHAQQELVKKIVAEVWPRVVEKIDLEALAEILAVQAAGEVLERVRKILKEGS